VAAVTALVNRCYRGDPEAGSWTSEGEFIMGLRTTEEEIRSLVTGEDSSILLGIDREEIIGSVHLQRQGTECYLGLLVVKPELQGAGIGKRLMQEAERFARESWSSRKMTMTVISRRTELIAFYERRGYRRTGEKKPFPPDGSHGTPQDAELNFDVLEKILGPDPPGK